MFKVLALLSASSFVVLACNGADSDKRESEAREVCLENCRFSATCPNSDGSDYSCDRVCDEFVERERERGFECLDEWKAYLDLKVTLDPCDTDAAASSGEWAALDACLDNGLGGSTAQ